MAKEEIELEQEQDVVVDDESVDEAAEPLEDQISALEAKVADEKDRALRAQAEAQNFKRRLQQDKEQALKYAAESFVRELLPILDSFDRAAEQAQGTDQKLEDVVDGFKLIQKQFLDFFEKSEVVPIEALGQKFDPNLHQAVSQQPAEDGQEPDMVVAVMQAGYMYHDRVIRPAMVVVSQ